MAALGFAASSLGQQASITLQSANAVLSNYSVASWTLTKNGTFTAGADNPGVGEVNWSVAATRVGVSQVTLSANGFVQVQNTGTATATISNIVVNLQKSTGMGGKTTNWATVASDIATSYRGDAATTANIVSGASSEAKSSFSENAASGTLEFTDAANNTAFALNPAKVLAPGEAANLLFAAHFNNSALSIPAGTSVRLEVIVTFGNAGARGGSGASGTNIDINGDGVIGADELHVRSVPTRITLVVPATTTVNDNVIVTDEAISSSGTVTLGTLPAPLVAGVNGSTTFPVAVAADGGVQGGYASNSANLSGADLTAAVQTGTQTSVDPITLQTVTTPVYTTVLVVGGTNLVASSNVVVPAEQLSVTPPPPADGVFVTYTQGGWGGTPKGANPASILANAFQAVYPNGLVVGGKYTMTFRSATAVGSYLPAGGPAAALTANVVNPTSTSAGVFGGQVVALRLNVDLSAAGITTASGGPVGARHLVNTGTAFDGATVTDVLAAAQKALGGGGLPTGTSFSALNDLVTNLNEAYDNGVRSSWAQEHLAN